MLLKREVFVREIPYTSAPSAKISRRGAGKARIPTQPAWTLQHLAFPASIAPFAEQNELYRCASEVRACGQGGNDTSRWFSGPRKSGWQSVGCCNPGPPG